ncbi:MAG: tetratricopeptide repeat protein [Acidobacteriota bacterium]|nr:tetratricopeptide repeat protein [Acidobacteriota bacterium]
MQYILRGNYDAALRQLNGAKTSGASPAEVENLRGLALLLRGDLKQALQSFDRALSLDPALEAARFNRGLAWLRSADNAKAVADLQQIYANDQSPLRGDAAYHLGIALDRLGRAKEAEAALDRALTLDAKLDGALLYVGMLRERRGDLQGAGRAYRDYLNAHPQSTAAMLRFGMSAHKAGRTEVAKSYLEKVIATAPQSADAVEARKFLVMWE